jgi:tetratricopeptide (TPR) repeat protein
MLLGRKVGFGALIGLPILGCVLLLYANQYRPTGDRLYDAAARLALRQYRRCQPPPYEGVLDRLGISSPWNQPDFELPVTELVDFAGTPNWAEMSLFMDLGAGANKRTLVEDYLAEGRATPGMFLKVSPHLWYADDEAKALRLYDAAIALEPANSWFYYEKAMCLLSLGEVEEAGETCRRGNAAPVNRVPWPYPVNKIIASEVGSGRQNALAAGLLLTLADGTPNWVRIKEGVQEP